MSRASHLRAVVLGTMGMIAVASYTPAGSALGLRPASFTKAALDGFAELSSHQPVLTVLPPAPVEVTAGRRAVAQLKFRIGAGYHVNSNKPRAEFLIPTTLTLSAPPKIEIAKIIYPPGEDISLPFDPSAKLSVYTGEFTISVSIEPGHSLTPGAYPVRGEIRYQACNDNSCFPPKTLPLDFEVVVSAKSKIKAKLNARRK